MVVVQMTAPFSKRDKFSTPEINEAKQIRDAAQTEHKVAKLRQKAATKRNKSAHQREKAALFRKKAAKARELMLIYKEEAELLEGQAIELERTLKPIVPDRNIGYDRGPDRSRDYDRGPDRSRDYNRDNEW